MSEQKLLWIRDNTGAAVPLNEIWIRENGAPKNIDKVWVRNASGIPEQVFPTGETVVYETEFNSRFYNFAENDIPGFDPQNNSPIPSFPSAIKNSVGSGLFYFDGYGYNKEEAQGEYGTYIWNSSGTDPLGGLDWGFWGTVTRRIPKINTVEGQQSPSQYINKLWIRPNTFKHLTQVWDNQFNAMAWDQNDNVNGVLPNQLERVYNLPKLNEDVYYYEYTPQPRLGTRGSSELSLRKKPDRLGNNVTANNANDWRSSNSTDHFLQPKAEPPTAFASGSFVDETPAIPMVKIDQTGATNFSGKWVVITKWQEVSGSVTSSNNRRSRCSTSTGDFPCHLGENSIEFTTGDGFTGTNKWVDEKEIIVALVANKENGTGSAYDFAADYNDNSTGSGQADFYTTNKWVNWNGSNSGKNVFMFFRYRTDCFSKRHEDISSNLYNHKDAELKEFWIQPAAWRYVNGTGASWNSNYIGMVLDTLPVIYKDGCRGFDLNETALTLPKYYYWNIPIPTCENRGTSIVGRTVVSGTDFGWGTPTAYTSWTDATTKQDLYGSGVGSWNGFDPAPDTDVWPNYPGNSYTHDLYDFNGKNSSIDGFPFGVGHSYGGDFLSQIPWCPCTDSFYPGSPIGQNPSDSIPSLRTAPPCPCRGVDWPTGTSQNPSDRLITTNTAKCCTPVAQPTSVYLLDQTNEANWDPSTWSSGLPSTVDWGGCLPDRGVCCESDLCFNSDGLLDINYCGSCFKESDCPYCNCQECVDLVCEFIDPDCCETSWNADCVAYALGYCVGTGFSCSHDPCRPVSDGGNETQCEAESKCG